MQLRDTEIKGLQKEKHMARFYFTYGTEGQPFYGGWSVAEAPDRHLACAAFRAYHPDKIETLLNCSSVYNEELFRKTAMAAEGNFGARCHEIIHLSRELLTVESEGS